MSDKANYINGLFIEEKDGAYGKYLSIGITKEGLEEISNLQTSAKGWRNLTASRQKNNDAKFSVKPYTPKAQGRGVKNTSTEDDLPF